LWTAWIAKRGFVRRDRRGGDVLEVHRIRRELLRARQCKAKKGVNNILDKMASEMVEMFGTLWNYLANWK
jgi:hypothetical protein